MKMLISQKHILVFSERASKSEYTFAKHYNLKMNYSQDIKQKIFSESGGRVSFKLAGFYKYFTLITFDINIFVSFKICMFSVNRMDQIIPRIKKKLVLAALVTTTP